MPRRLRAIDFFCGAGGASVGARWAGVEIVAAVNHWVIAATTYAMNHGVEPFRMSMAQIDPSDLPQADVLLFSPECTNHARAKGSKPRDENSRNTAWEVVRFVTAIKPYMFIVENVMELRGWHRFGEWSAALQAAGYTLNRDHEDRIGQILNSADFGAPQARRRLFVVGVQGAWEPTIMNPRKSHVPASECIDFTLPMKPVEGRKKALCERTMERIRLAEEAFGEGPCLLVYYGEGPQVHSLDLPCRTITTRDRFALYHRGQTRFLQPPELLRIMGLPESYQMHGTREQRIMQLGNGVVPHVEREILEQFT